MKKLLFYSLLLLLPLSLFAQRNVNQLLTGPISTPVYKTYNPQDYIIQGDVKVPNDIQLFGTMIDTLNGTYFNYGTSTPLIFDPDSKLTILATSRWFRNPNGDAQGNPYMGEFALRFSSDYGQTWSAKKRLMYAPGYILAWPSVAVTNPNKSTNSNDLYIQAYSWLYFWEGWQSNPSYYYKGGWFLQSYPGSSVDTINIATTDENTEQGWSQCQMLADYRNNVSTFYSYGTLRPTDQQNYCYGVAIRSENNEHYYLPPQWSPNKFVQASTPGGLYNMDMYMDKDNSGNLYALVDDRFLPPGSADTTRQPGVSKCTNQGETWSDFQKDTMPTSLIDDFNAANGAYANAYALPYIDEGFVVTGTDQYSFAFTIILSNAQTDYRSFLVEASKSGGTWQPLRAISEMAGAYPMVIHSDVAGTQDTINRNARGFETQLSRTADNQYIICKWIDYNGDSAVFSPAITLAGGTSLTQLYKNDVYMAYRKVSEPTWSVRISATNNVENQKHTTIPPVVNSITEVTLITSHTVQATTGYRAAYSSNANQFINDFSQVFSSKKIDLTQTAVEYQPAPVSDFYLGDVYPNPTSGIANISFSSNKTDFATLELYNELGQKVKLMYNDNIYTGKYIHTLNTDDLPVGTYYYKLTIGTQSLTKILNVIK
jgi:hypothetical protein